MGTDVKYFMPLDGEHCPRRTFSLFFLVYVMEGPYSLFLFLFHFSVCSRIFTAARLHLPFSSFSLFLLIFIATSLSINTVLCSCGNNSQVFTPKFFSTACLISAQFYPDFCCPLPVTAII